MTDHLHQLAKQAKEAARQLALYDTEQKNRALLAIAQALEDNIPAILAANARDVESAQENGVRPTMIDRLRLDEGRVRSMAEGARQVAQLPDPTGNVLETIHRPNGMVIEKVSVPMGVIGIIYEARPNVTVDSAVLCFKAGSAAFLRGGKEAFFSNTQLAKVMRSALEQEGLCPDCVILLDDTSRETAQQMMGLRGYIDVLIPRGGAGLIRSVVENAKVPVIETGTGNCHIYVDKDADLDMAVEILYNAKCSRPSVCNAAESLLVHQDVAEEFLPRAKQKLDECKVEWRGSPRTVAILPGIAPATLEDYAAEYNDYILSCKVIDGLDEDIAHISRYSTGHSECIVTRNEEAARRFARSVDSAAVYINASTRFTDGSEFGMGAEIGISTQKLHARGPMGLRELTSYKYVILGSGQVR